MEIINIEPSNELSGFYLVYYGSCNVEGETNHGISHFMEHLVAKSFDDLQDEYDENGINFNAYTSDNEIVFHWTGLEENLSKFRPDILKRISKLNYNKEEFENEKSIIIQEYYDAFNGQTESHYLNLCRKEFNHYSAIGYLEDIQNFSYQDSLKTFKKYFSSPYKIINISPIKMDEKKSKLKDFSQFDSNAFSFTIKKNKDAKLEKMNDYNGKRSIIVFSKPIKNQKHIVPVQFLTYMLSSGLNSPLYKEIREKRGLVYYIQNWIGRFGSTGIMNFASQTTEENVEKFQKVLYEILENPKKYLTQKRFDTIKNKLLIGIKKKNINKHSSTEKYIEPKEWIMENYILDLTLKDCMEIYDLYFNPNTLTFTTDKDY